MTPLNLNTLGRQIRAARVAKRLTLEEVVSRTGFTISWLSKIENGLLAPSLEGLVRLAEALECGVEYLVAGLSTPPRFVVDRRGEGRMIPGRNSHSGTLAHPLAEAWRQRTMLPEILRLSSNFGRRPGTESHDGERFLYVLEGDVKVSYGTDVIQLGPGDSIYIDAAIQHSISPAGRTSAQVLSVSFEPGRHGLAAASNNGHPRRKGSRTAATGRSARG